MSIVAFDSGDFTRRKKINSDKEIVFFTPLGIGVEVKNELREKFVEEYHHVVRAKINHSRFQLKDMYIHMPTSGKR